MIDVRKKQKTNVNDVLLKKPVKIYVVKTMTTKIKNLKVLKLIVVTMVMALKKNREVPYTKLLTKNKPK